MAKVTVKNLEPVHIRTGRACLDWSNQHLADKCGVSASYIRKFESGRGASDALKQSIIDVLEREGVTLYNGGRPGARLMRPKQSDS